MSKLSPASDLPDAPQNAPIEAEIVDTEPLKPAREVTGEPARKWWKFWAPRAKKPKRALLARLFGIGLWGGLKLAVLCMLVGFVLLTIQFDPATPDFNITQTIGQLVKNAVGAAIWTGKNFWQPALTGAILVLPLWVLWRLVTLPFRR